MIKKATTLIALAALVVVGAIFPGSASAYNRHQDHRGACARSTQSINKGVGDLAYNGVVRTVARRLGIKSYNGSITKQLKNQLIIGRVYRSKRTRNHGCDGHRRMFGAGKRTLYKGESVAVKVPAKYGKDACTRPSRRCKVVVIKVKTTFPTSCWNPNYGWVKVKIWIKRDHKPARPPKPTPPAPPAVPPAPPAVCVVIINGDNSGNAGCGNTQICTANGKYNGNPLLCNSYNSCVAIQGNTWNSSQNVCVTSPPPPPVCPDGSSPPCQTAQAPSVTLNSVQEVYPNETNVIVAKATVQQGHSYRVCFNADFGSFSPSCSATLTGTGTPEQVTSSYTAPIDVSSDAVTATAYDLTSGQNATNDITIPVLPENPPGGRP